MKINKTILLLVAWILFAGQLMAQYSVSGESTAIIKGTSSLHDWESEVEEISGSAKIAHDGKVITEIEALSLSFVTKSIESGKGKMNSLTYEALREEKFNTIEFKLLSVEQISGNKVTARGTLILAGVKKDISVSGIVTINEGEILIKSTIPIDMTHYNIDPPTALMGTIKVGKDVTVDFNLVFKL